jgi:hypothetical protein
MSDTSLSRFTEAAAVAAAAVFLCSWALLHTGWYDDYQIVDIPIYLAHGEAIVDGQAPYRDVKVEYPPGALPAFVVPALLSDDESGFRRVFEVLMALAGMAMTVLVGVALGGLRATRRHVVGALAVVALFPLVLGAVVLTRFDLWPALVVAAAFAALLSGRERLGLGLLGAAVAVKLYALVLLPVALSYVWARRDRRELLAGAAAAGGVAAACCLPFVLLAPGGFADSIVGQLARPLQLESLGASLLLAAHHLFGLEVTMTSGSGSQNLAGTAAELAAWTTSVLQLAVLAWIWARRVETKDELVRWSAASLVAFVALGKVLSPQFPIWLVPLVPLVRGRRGAAASLLLLAAMALTQLWFPFRYWDLALHFDGTTTALVVARNLTLLALLAVLTWPHRTRTAP